MINFEQNTESKGTPMPVIEALVRLIDQAYRSGDITESVDHFAGLVSAKLGFSQEQLREAIIGMDIERRATKYAQAQQGCEPVFINGMTESETSASMSVIGLSKPLKPEQETVALRRALSEALASVYVCGRVWDAWSVGTMTEGDFQPAAECEEVLDSLIEAVTVAASPLAQPGQSLQEPGVSKDLALKQALEALYSGPSTLHTFPLGEDCKCSQCEFVRLRKPAIGAINKVLAQSTKQLLVEQLPNGLYAVNFLNNWDGENDLEYVFAYFKNGMWTGLDNNEPLIVFEGDKVVKAWPLFDAATTK